MYVNFGCDFWREKTGKRRRQRRRLRGEKSIGERRHISVYRRITENRGIKLTVWKKTIGRGKEREKAGTLSNLTIYSVLVIYINTLGKCFNKLDFWERRKVGVFLNYSRIRQGEPMEESPEDLLSWFFSLSSFDSPDIIRRKRFCIGMSVNVWLFSRYFLFRMSWFYIPKYNDWEDIRY